MADNAWAMASLPCRMNSRQAARTRSKRQEYKRKQRGNAAVVIKKLIGSNIERRSVAQFVAKLVEMPIKKRADYIPIKCEGWNGRFVYGQGATNNVSKVQRHNQNITDASNFYGFNRDPIVLPPTWDGTFKKSDDTRLVASRNYSDVRNYVNATQCYMVK